MPRDPRKASAARSVRRKRAHLDQTLATLRLGGGWLAYPDASPGVGWVLEGPWGEPKRYWATREECLARFVQLGHALPEVSHAAA